MAMRIPVSYTHLLLHTLDLEHHNLLDFGLCQWQEHDGFVDTVQELSLIHILFTTDYTDLHR